MSGAPGTFNVSKVAVALTVCLIVSGEAGAFQQERLENYADRIAQCFIERGPEPARRWLQTVPGSRAEDTILRARAGGFFVCADAANVGDVWAVNMGVQRSRDLVAAAVLRTDYPTLPSELPPQPTTGTWISRVTSDLPNQTHFNRTAVQMLMFGDCLARAQWPAVARLLQSSRRSEAERAAITELRPHLAGCLPAGLTLRIDQQVMRTVLTEPAYHILVDTPADLSRVPR